MGLCVVQVETTLLQLMSTKHHPLYIALELFTALFRELYSRQAGVMETTKIAASTLEKYGVPLSVSLCFASCAGSK